MKYRLSNASVEKLVNSDARPKLFHDEECKGFCVVVSRTGAKAFYFYGRVQGHPKRILIGKFPELNVTQARTICRGIIGDVAQGKVDPSPKRKGGKTLQEAFDAYVELHAKETKRTWERDVQNFEKYLARHGRKPLQQFTRAFVSSLVAAHLKPPAGKSRGGSKSTAHKVRSLLSSIFSFSIEQGWCEANPVLRTHRPTYQKRERYLSTDEVKLFFSAIARLRYETTRDFMLLLLLTGARRSNVASMELGELDLKAALWTIPTTKFKGKRALVVPLVPDAVRILKKRAKATERYIFPGRSGTGHLTWIQDAIDSIRKEPGPKGTFPLKDLRLHDLRRTVGAWQNAAGVPLRVIQEGLGHADIRTTASIYTPTENAAVREALEEYAQLLLQASRPDENPDPPSRSAGPQRPAPKRKGRAGRKPDGGHRSP